MNLKWDRYDYRKTKRTVLTKEIYILSLSFSNADLQKNRTASSVSVVMSSWTRISFLIALLNPCCLDLAQSALFDEELEANKFIATNEFEQFLQLAQNLGEGFGSKWILMPDGDGTTRVAIMQNYRTLLPEGVSVKSYTEEAAGDAMTFHYYNSNKSEEYITFRMSDFDNVPFDDSKPTKLIIHGWMANANSSVITEIKKAYLARGNLNVIGVDWSPIAEDYYYPNSAGATDVIGKVVGRLIDSLVKNHNANYKDFHLIGHSLGAHVVGFAGKSTEQKIGRITGLDPALPGFQYVTGPEGRLDRGDGEFVDVIHTCSGVLGISVPIGHVDFYPNGGSVVQPGCATRDFFLKIPPCSHSRSHQFFAESISKTADFEAVRCSDWDHFKSNNCEDVFTVMGENIPRDTKPGVYYLKTSWEPPFSQGHDGIKF